MQIDGEAIAAVSVIVGALASTVGVLFKRASDREVAHSTQLLKQQEMHDKQIEIKDGELATERRERRVFVETQLAETRAARDADRELYERIEALVAGQVGKPAPYRGPMGSGGGGGRR